MELKLPDGNLKMNIPLVPPALVDYLNNTVPAKSPQKGETLEELQWRGGQRSVVELLQQAVKNQRGDIN